MRDIVNEDSGVDVIWTITGTLFRPKTYTGNSAEDFLSTKTVTEGFGVPRATYKIVEWFDRSGRFQARGLVFEQEDREPVLEKYPTKIDDIEARAGIDFFPQLCDSIENQVEAFKPSDL